LASKPFNLEEYNEFCKTILANIHAHVYVYGDQPKRAYEMVVKELKKFDAYLIEHGLSAGVRTR
jgi:hypothetical protein